MEMPTRTFGRRSVIGAAGAMAAATAAAVATAPGAAAAAGRAADVVVDDRAALKALDTSSRTVAYLTEPGREGTFVWREGDYSAQVAADGREGVFVASANAPATTGAWVREHSGTLDVRWFGAVGDGTTDDSPAVQGSLDLAAALAGAGTFHGIAVYAPAGTYRMRSRAVCDVRVSSTSATGISLVGDGPQNTYLVADADNRDGLVTLTSDSNGEVWRVSGLGLLSDLPADAPVNNGIALEVSSSVRRGEPGWGVHKRRSVRIESVYVGGYGDSRSDLAYGGNFAKGIFVANKWWPFLTDVYVSGDSPSRMFTNWFGARQPDPGEIPSEAELWTYELTGRSHAIHFKDCYSPILTDIYVDGYYDYGVQIQGRDADQGPSDFEDFRLTDSYVVGTDVALSVWHSDDQAERGLYEPGGAVSNCHLNAHTYGVHLRYHRQVVISGVYFYVPRGRGPANYSGLPSAVFLDGADDVTVAGCQFLEPGYWFDDDNSTCGIRASRRVTANVVGSTFAHGGIGIRTDAGTTGNITVTSSQFVGATFDTVWAPLTPRLDLAGIVAEEYVERLDGTEPGAQHVVRSQAAGSEATVRSILRSERPDYGSKADPVLGDWRVVGRNSDGGEVTASVIRTRLHDNAAGSETSGVDVFALAGGSDPVRIGGFTGELGDDDTNLLVGIRVDGSLDVRRVEIGAADSAGAGYRTLRLPN